LLTRNTDEMNRAKAKYLEMFGTSVEEDVADDTSGDFRKFVYSLSRVNFESNYFMRPRSLNLYSAENNKKK